MAPGWVSVLENVPTKAPTACFSLTLVDESWMAVGPGNWKLAIADNCAGVKSRAASASNPPPVIRALASAMAVARLMHWIVNKARLTV